jgi:hypothetical protein
MSSDLQTLAQFLANQKAQYIRDVSQNNGAEWTVVMGNEAGGMFLFHSN